ncbi:MAG: hypothetical protein U1C56_00225 [Candidatus Curtissbacteria bacterium]|nr:hypothetical protein [Patescibacteria group bacterium]MDZ4209584.1 hypothetical protein [Candidatus Curtissbacteria bacterium]
MSKDIKSVDDAILDQAAWTFKDSERVRSAIHFLKENPKEFQVRTEQFDMLVREMNKMMQKGSIDPYNFNHLNLLAEQLDGKKIPQLFDLSLQRQLKKLTGKGDATIVDGIDKAFTETGTWTWPQDVTNDNQLASGVLIEGFGYLLEKLTGVDDVKRNFVLAFEEVGIIKVPNISIMRDVMPWLVEEKEAFSPGAQRVIEKLTPVTA